MMTEKQKYCTEPIEVEVEGKIVSIRFKIPKFILPGRGLISSAQLVEQERLLQQELLSLQEDGASPELILSTSSRMALPKLLASYVESNTGSQVFDYEIVPAEAQAPKAGKKVKKETEVETE